MREPWRTWTADAVICGVGFALLSGLVAARSDAEDPWLAALTGLVVGALMSPLFRLGERKRQARRDRRR